MDFESLIEDYTPLMLSLLKSPLQTSSSYNYKLTKEEREDLYQHLCMEIMEQAPLYDPEKGVPFPGFIKGKLRWSAHNYVEKLIQEKDTVQLHENMVATIITDNTEDELSSEMIEAMKTLTDKQRDVIELHYIRGLRVVDVAELLGIRQQEVITHRKLALDKIKKRLK